MAEEQRNRQRWLETAVLAGHDLIVLGERGSYKSKRTALEAAGAVVLDTPSGVGDAMKAKLAAR